MLCNLDLKVQLRVHCCLYDEALGAVVWIVAADMVIVRKSMGRSYTLP